MDEANPTTITVDNDADEPTSILILTSLYQAAETIIAKANRRLARAGVQEQFTLEIIETVERAVDTSEGQGSETLYEFYRCHLSHPVISVGGWEFIAKAEYDADVDEILLKTNPSATDVEHLQAPEKLHCVHCKTQRARRQAYLIRQIDTGEIKTVGTQCVAPFLGLKVTALFWLDGSITEDLRNLEPSGQQWADSRRVSREWALSLAWAASDEGRSYVSSRGDHPTRGVVADALWPSPRETSAAAACREMLVAQARAYAADEDLLAAIIGSAQTLDPSTNYGRTMALFAAAEFIGANNLGYMVSLVAVYRRHLDGEQRRKAKIADNLAITAGLFAEEGSLISDITVKVTAIHGYEGAYGSGLFVTMLTGSGHQLKWKSSSDKAYDLEIGDEVHIARARIKDLDTYAGVDSTMITRPTLKVLHRA